MGSLIKRLAVIAFAACVLVAAGGPARAQDAPEPAAVAQRFADWNGALDKIGREVGALKLDAPQIDVLTEQADAVRSQALEFNDEIQGYVDAARELRDAFVASSPVGAAASAETQAQGKALEERVALFEGWARQVDLTTARADQLLERISAKRLELLAASLTQRGPIPLNPLAWWRATQEAWAMAGFMAVSSADEARSWLQPAGEARDAALTALFAALVAGLVVFGVVGVVTRRSWPVIGPVVSGPASQILLAALRPAAPWIAALLAVWLVTPLKDWLPEAGGRTVIVALVAAGYTMAIGVWILRAAVIQPTAMVPDGADRAALARALMILIVFLAVDAAIQQLTATFVSANLLAVWVLVFTVAGSVATRAAARTVARVLAQQRTADGKLVRFLLALAPPAVALVAVVASALGYAALGSYLFSNSLATVGVLVLAGGLRLAAHEVVVGICDPESRAGRALQDRLGVDRPALRLTQFWLSILLDVAVAVGFLVAIMIVWGTGTADTILMLQRLIEGVRVGNVTLSLADLLAAMLTFVVGFWLTRFAQRILDKRVFPGTQLDPGVRNSLRSGLGYVGVILAGGLAVLALGINFSSLALVAGALSVGIGFGLQHIINNFVSGLILLIERPVKVGDWITVGQNEGLVNRINVRSTEIITNDRASVLIPNADFLSVSVTNWTLKDRGARLHLTFQLPVTIGADAGRDLLLACARAHSGVLAEPPPRVLLQSIAEGYTFELEADVGDVATMKEIASDLRFAVDRRLLAYKAG